MPTDKPLKDPGVRKAQRAFATAIAILDESELQVRDLIETRLAIIPASPNARAKLAVELTREIAAIRLPLIKKGFRHLRDTLDPL